MTSMLDRTLYAAVSYLVAPKEKLAPLLEAHLAFMVRLEERGVLFASGPFYVEGTGTGDGLTIVRAGSLAEAQAILAADPFALAGLRGWDVREWHVMEGAIRVTVHASRQRGSLP